MSNEEDDSWRQWELYAVGAALSAAAIGYAVHRQQQKKIDLHIGSHANKTVIITGSNTGVGLQTAIHCARAGANVVMACRNETLGKQAADEVKKLTGNSKVSFQQLDVTSFESIERFAKSTPECHVLINNAGAMFKNREFILGIEKSMFTNYIGQFYLTNLMMPVLVKTSLKEKGAEVRVINIGSRSEKLTTLGTEYLNRKEGSSGLEICTRGPEPYGYWPAYGASKFCDIVCTFELHRRINRGVYSDINTVGGVNKNKANITVNTVTPGLVHSDLARFASPLMLWLTWPIRYFGLKSAEEGAKGIAYVALSKDFNGVSGKYWTDGKELQSSEVAHNEPLGRDLWIESERLVGFVKDQLKK